MANLIGTKTVSAQDIQNLKYTIDEYDDGTFVLRTTAGGGGGSGTQYTEGGATAATPTGTMAMYRDAGNNPKGVTPSQRLPTEVRQELYTAPSVGEFQGSITAGVLPTVAGKFARIKARSTNAGSVYLGVSGVTKPDGSTDTTTGFELTPGDDTGWMPIDNLNRFYRICDNATDAITYMVLA